MYRRSLRIVTVALLHVGVSCAVLHSNSAACSLFANEAGAAAPPFFESTVEQILRDKCVRCHGGKETEAGLDLSTAAGVLTGGESGNVLQSGKPQESLLWQKIRDGQMPPEDEQDRLTDAQIDSIRQWIDGGAKFRRPPDLKRRITQHDVIPILLLRCTACHGARKQEADLDLRTKESILKGGKSGPAVVVRKPEESLLVKRIKAEEMPPRRKLVEASVKPMPATELELLESWIRDGMPESDIGPDVATTEPDPLVSDKDRQFWSFQPPKQTSIPVVKYNELIRNPIDAFILEKLEERGISFSPEASRLTLLRRVTFDLTGLPPSSEEIDEFIADTCLDAYERLVDRLLSSPRYGERWGRHWLDVAGYADSEGAQNEDRVRPHMYRYRDYVIRAFNSDKPYDRFMHEQIAGDELADYESAAEINDELYDNLVATGFLRTAPDRTFADITNFVPDRLEVIADEIQIFGSAVLGLTINCARCHTHKFDPIPQRDYYRLAAVFKDAYDEHDWLKPQGPRTMRYITTAERHEWQQHQQAIDSQIEPLTKQLESEGDESKMNALMEQIKALESQKKPEPGIRALWSRGEPSPTYILKRGDYLTAGTLVGPGVLSVLTDGRAPFVVDSPWPGAKQTGRRLALAKWLTQSTHPLTARVMVNRIWKHHFRTGIVSTLDNFGITGERPSHPELLDWLAVEFVRQGWSIKSLHRLIVTSSTYRQSSLVDSERLAADPDGRLLSHMPLRRMDAEALRDSLLDVAGQLNLAQFGPADEIAERGDGLITVPRSNGGWRRTVYVLQRRTKTPTILESFDFPQMGPNCIERSESVVAPQALHLLNDATVYDLAGHFADRVLSEADDDPAEQINRIYLIALSRRPTDQELKLGLEALNELRDQWLAQLTATDCTSISNEATSKEAARRALANYCHAVMNSAAFLYID